MTGIISALVITPFFVAGLGGIIGLYYALNAFGTMEQTTGEQRRLCLLFGIHLGEPLVTVLWMVFWWNVWRSMTMALPHPLFALVLTAPMASLLTPVVGFWWSDPLYRDWAVGTFILGVCRWVISFGLILIFINGGSLIDPLIAFLIIGAVVGIVLLWVCVFRVRRILDQQTQRLITHAQMP